MLVRGAFFQLLFIASLLVLVSIVAGTLALLLTSGFEGLETAAWWAFLRLSDPGYLGDDEGITLRVISTIVTVLGYVLFMGALIAIMTQWLNSTMRRLESGLTPLTLRGHLLILGWTNRTPAVIRELVLSVGRVRRYLARIGASRLRIVVLAEDVSSALTYELREHLGDAWKPGQIILRSGSPLRVEHLRRVDFLNAATILVPGADFAEGGVDLVDTRTVKTLLSISNSSREVEARCPAAVAEIFDTGKLPAARASYDGDIEMIASDSVISRLIAHNIRHPGLSHVYSELLSHGEDSNEIYIRRVPELAGEDIRGVGSAFPRALVLGLLRPRGEGMELHLNPRDSLAIDSEDRLVFVSRAYDDAEPSSSPDDRIQESRSPLEVEKEPRRTRLLILGWNHKIPALIDEFDSYRGESFRLDIMSLVPVEEREQLLRRRGVRPEHIELDHVVGDYVSEVELRAVEPHGYDRLLFLSSNRMESSEESDARTILGYMVLKEVLGSAPAPPRVLVELMDSANEGILGEHAGEVVVSPLIVSHLLAHVALRRDLNVVFEELFTVGGAEIYLRPARVYGLEGEGIAFREIQRAIAARGDIALGVYPSTGSKQDGVTLNPERDSRWHLTGDDQIVVLSTYQTAR